MKIAYISESTIPSRTANSIHVMKMCQALAKNGHDVVLLVPKRLHADLIDTSVYAFYGVEEIFEIRWVSAPTIPMGLGIYGFNCLKELAHFKPELVYGRSLHGCTLAAIRGYRVMWEVHSPLPALSRGQVIFYHFLKKSKNFIRLVVISEALSRMYRTDDPTVFEKLLVAHDGADEQSDFEPALKRPFERLQIGYFGHLYKGRGIDIIIALSQEMPEADFHIVGGSEADIAYWKNSADSGNLFFHGFKQPYEVHRYRNSCDILLAPYQTKVSIANAAHSTAEYMSPLKIFEYMSSRKPIIASDLPVLREVLNDENAVLVHPERISEWREAIQRLFDPNVRQLLAEKAFEDFVTHYTWRKRAEYLIGASQ